MNKKLLELAASVQNQHTWSAEDIVKFGELVVNDCIGILESYEIPVGNSAAGEMACEWTYDALKQIRSDVKDHFKE